MLQLLLSLPLAAFLSVLFLRMVKEDNACGKIRNAIVLRGLAAVAAACPLLGLQTLAGSLAPGSSVIPPHPLPAVFFLRYLQHGFISFIAAFMLWKCGTWPAGDAKLFILAALTIPLLIPGAAYFPNLLFLAMLINILVPAALAFVIQALVSAFKRLIKKDRGDLFSFLRLCCAQSTQYLAEKAKDPGKAAAFLLLTALFGVARFLRNEYPGFFKVDELLFFGLIMVVWPAISGLLKLGGRIALGAIGLCAGLCFFYPFGRELLLHAAYGITRSIPFLIFYKALEGLMSRDSLITIAPCAISQGTILDESFLKTLKQAAPDFYSENFGTKYPDGITAQQAEDLKAHILGADTPSPELSSVAARAARPFAEWIAAGTVLTLALHGETVITLCKYAIFHLNV